ncbi:hypothetical protein GCM10009646_69980 [Streptomyces aureus]
MTTTTRPAAVTGREETIPPPPGEPIFAALAARWSAQGRVVPGQLDREWVRLADNCPWPTR